MSVYTQVVWGEREVVSWLGILLVAYATLSIGFAVGWAVGSSRIGPRTWVVPVLRDRRVRRTDADWIRKHSVRL